MSCDVDVVIIGAGVIGLAVASQTAREGREVYVLEKNEVFGREASSRNSGTIHTGILSPRGSWNSRLCCESNPLIYEFCRKYGVDYRQTGKLLVACDATEVAELDTLFQRQDEGIQMQRLSPHEIQKLEPELKGESAILLPAAGVVDPYGLMRSYLGLARLNFAQLVCKSEVIGIEKIAEGYRVHIQEPDQVSTLRTRVVINCAGLYSDKVAAMAGLDIVKGGYKLNYFKGEYYSICSKKAKLMDKRLIYPLLRTGGLVGIHTVLDIDRRVRLGPHFYPVDEIDYSVDDSHKPIFLEGIKKLFPFIESEDIDPESSGVMPRLYSKNENFKDFIICHEEVHGLVGFVNVVGIETPGLTASLAIAQYVSHLVDNMLKN